MCVCFKAPRTLISSFPPAHPASRSFRRAICASRFAPSLHAYSTVCTRLSADCTARLARLWPHRWRPRPTRDGGGPGVLDARWRGLKSATTTSVSHTHPPTNTRRPIDVMGAMCPPRCPPHSPCSPSPTTCHEARRPHAPLDWKMCHLPFAPRGGHAISTRSPCDRSTAPRERPPACLHGSHLQRTRL